VNGVMLVARGDRVLRQHEYGYAGWQLRTPITHATRFGIGDHERDDGEDGRDAAIRRRMPKNW
jgi:hypothetical protein